MAARGSLLGRGWWIGYRYRLPQGKTKRLAPVLGSICTLGAVHSAPFWHLTSVHIAVGGPEHYIAAAEVKDAGFIDVDGACGGDVDVAVAA